MGRKGDKEATEAKSGGLLLAVVGVEYHKRFIYISGILL